MNTTTVWHTMVALGNQADDGASLACTDGNGPTLPCPICLRAPSTTFHYGGGVSVLCDRCYDPFDDFPSDRGFSWGGAKYAGPAELAVDDWNEAVRLTVDRGTTLAAWDRVPGR